MPNGSGRTGMWIILEVEVITFKHSREHFEALRRADSSPGPSLFGSRLYRIVGVRDRDVARADQ